MRWFEIALLIANTLSALALIPLPRDRLRWLQYVVPFPFLMAVAQVTTEGPRWQMVPAYGLAGLFLVGWLARHQIAQAWRHQQKTIKGLAATVVVFGLLTSVALPTALPVFRFPPPSGPHAIGTLTYHWVDASRREVFAVDPTARRELMIQIWYPAASGSRSTPVPYVEDSAAFSKAQARLHRLPDFVLEHLGYVVTNASPSVPISDETPSYPVLIFLEGLTGYRQMNTFQVEALVSHGYIVVGIDQPFVAAAVGFPDGRQIAGLSKDQIDPLIQQSLDPGDPAPILSGTALPDGIIPYLAQDVSFVLGQLAALNMADPQNIMAGRLDMQRVGVFGVSIGAIVAGEACFVEPRLRACLMMDAPMTARVVREGTPQPSMWITRDADTMRREGWIQGDIDQHLRTMRAAFERGPRQSYFVQAPGVFHANLTDVPYFSPLLPWMGVTGTADPKRTHDMVNAYSLAFFDRHLRGRPAPLLDRQTAGIFLEVRRR